MNRYSLGKQKTLAELCEKKDEELKLLRMDFESMYSELKATRNRNDQLEELLQEIKGVILRGRLTLGEKLMYRIKAACDGYS